MRYYATIPLLLLSTTTTAFSCIAGQYSDAAGKCTACVSPETYSASGVATACSACAPGTSISGALCVTCTPGTFSSFSASTACQACPTNTGSAANASSCIRCSLSAVAKLAGGSIAIPVCNYTCTACLAGRYNDGISAKKCIGCKAGTFSTVVQAESSAACSNCVAGKTTLLTTTGAVACIGCDTVGMPTPLSATYAAKADPLVCAWQCNSGYDRFNLTAAAYTQTTYTNMGYTAAQAIAVFQNLNDYCCEPTTVKIGMYMCGTVLPTTTCTPACSRTADGKAASCPAHKNGYYLQYDKPSFNRCNDWICESMFFLNKTTGLCQAQPVCQDGHTYHRDATTAYYIVQPSGVYTCVPCTECIYGSEVTAACTRFDDFKCKLCSAVEYSRDSKCAPDVPYGYCPVRIRLMFIPAYQGRPSTYSDEITPIPWANISFAYGFFLNTYTKCQSSPPEQVFTGGDETCNRKEYETSMCLSPVCKTQCKQWNGSDGWYKLNTGACSPCIYDATCTATQYCDMTTCGPTTAPLCRDCPVVLLPNSVGWANPGKAGLPGPHSCDFACRDGFTKGSNYSCIPCPLMPNNSKITRGCNWTCSLGFVQDRTTCIPCVGVPAGCSVGYYIGYAALTSQCARCLPCTNLLANAVYTSTGLPNGPNTCGVRCLQGTFVSPGYGFDTYSNPVACDRCSAPKCVSGVTYLDPCSYLADADCKPCSECAVGLQVLEACTPTANTICTPCNGSLLPPNAGWAEGRGCMAWGCVAGFILEPNTTNCLRCKEPHDCINSDSYESDGCGRCVPCDLFLLLPGQCFNGDGQCGVSYVCDSDMFTAPEQLVLPTPIPQAFQAELSAEPSTTTYASMATLTLETAALTASTITSINTQISTDCSCDATVTAVTLDNVTTFCTVGGCPVFSKRRLLQTSPLYIDIALVSTTQSIARLQPPVLAGQVVLGWQLYECQTITDPVLINDRRRLVVYFKRTGNRWVDQAAGEDVSVNQTYVVLGIAGAIAVFIIAGCAVMFCVTRAPLKEHDDEPPPLPPPPTARRQRRYPEMRLPVSERRPTRPW